MKGLLLHTAADTTNLGVVGPIFPDGTFEYIPIDNSYGTENKTYRDFPARNTQYGEKLSDFIPDIVVNKSVHYDPDFDNCTYGQPVDYYPRSRVLENLKLGDVVFFVSSLAPYNAKVYEEKDVMLWNFQRGKKNKYVIGFFTVRGVARVFVFKSDARLALALLNVALCEEGEAPLRIGDIRTDLEILEKFGYVIKEGENYKLTRQGSESSRSGEDIVQMVYELWQDDENAQRHLLEKGCIDITILSGEVREEIVKTSHHYRRLKSLDWDHFVLIVGDPKRSALLTKAVQLTKSFETFSFALNDIGQAILKRNRDTLRGFRWIDADSVKLLAREIYRTNVQLSNKLEHLL
ncbi:MAG: hypothetical protein QXZ02_00620 [Candidatus Bathyarchaeia archaeon]